MRRLMKDKKYKKSLLLRKGLKIKALECMMVGFPVYNDIQVIGRSMVSL